MVSKSKLKMALAADKGTDFSKLHFKKKEKAANKKKGASGGVVKDFKKSGKKGKKVEDEWEDVEEEDDDDDASEDGGVAVDDNESEGEDDDAPIQVDFAALDESDSDSSAGENDQDNSESEGDEDEEDIPISDLEDLSDDEKEDIIPHQRLTINNTTALTAALKRIALPVHKLPFSEHQSIISSTPTDIPDISDDLNRELAFYSQSLSAAIEARKLLKAEGVPFTRPNDYFAEMVKADEHMAKVKGKLIEEAASKKASADARKQRDLKKFGKQVQVAKLQEREKEKKATLEKIKVLKRKRQDTNNDATNEADMFDVAVDDEISSSKRSRTDKANGGSHKRSKKDAKYGFGGKKRFAKSGDAMSSGDLSGFSSKRMKGKSGGGMTKKRPGKARRAGKR